MHSDRWLNFAVGVALATFIVFASAEAGNYMINKAANNTTKDTSHMSAFERGQYYFNHGPDSDGTYDLKEARRQFEAVIIEDPGGNDLAWYQLGRINFLEGRFDEAIYSFNQQIAYFEDTYPQVRYMLGLTHAYKARRTDSEEDWSKATEQFRFFLESAPESPWARTDLAWIYFAQGKFEEMIPVLEIGLESQPNNPWLLNMYGLALLNTGNKEEAKANFELAATAAAELTVTDWGNSYPGNDPAAWSDGLREFRHLIEKNLQLVSE